MSLRSAAAEAQFYSVSYSKPTRARRDKSSSIAKAIEYRALSMITLFLEEKISVRGNLISSRRVRVGIERVLHFF